MVLLVCHGRTAAETRRVLAGWTPGIHLDEEGRDQAKRLSERLAGLPVDGVVTSPLERCRETADTLAAGLSPVPDIASDLDLAECRYGDWTGRTLADLQHEPGWTLVQHHPSAVSFPSGESIAAVQARAVSAMRRWTRRFGPDGLFVAVTHASVIRCIVADAAGMHLDMSQRVQVDPASVSVVRYGGGPPMLVRLNGSDSGLAGVLDAEPATRDDSVGSLGEGNGAAAIG